MREADLSVCEIQWTGPICRICANPAENCGICNRAECDEHVCMKQIMVSHFDRGTLLVNFPEFSFCAWREGEEKMGYQYGWGMTREAAIADLLRIEGESR